MPIGARDRRYLGILAAGSLLILVVGVLVRPDSGQEGASPALAPDILQRELLFTQRRQVDTIADYFSGVAAQVEESVVLLGVSRHSGLVWQAGQVVTGARIGPFPATDRTAVGGQEVELRTQLAAPHLPYVLLDVPREARVSDRAPVRLYDHGNWVLAVWRSPDGGLRYAPGNLFGVADRRCGSVELVEVLTNLDTAAMRPGTGIFSLDGGLLAVMLPCAGSLAAVEISALSSHAHSEWDLEQHLIARVGMRVGEPSDQERSYFGHSTGLLVREVWWGYRAQQAGLLPGDLLLALDGSALASMDDLRPLILPVAREVRDLKVLRAQRELDLRIVSRAPSGTPVLAHGLMGAMPGLPIHAVLSGSVAEQAGARRGDRLLAIDDKTPASPRDVEMALRGGPRGVHLVLERAGRMWGALVPVHE